MYQNIDDLTRVKFLGGGTFGDVFLYKQNNSNKLYAVKIIDKSKVKNTSYFKTKIRTDKSSNYWT